MYLDAYLNQIINGEWFIDKQLLLGNNSIVVGLLTGNSHIIEGFQKPKLSSSLFCSNGDMLESTNNIDPKEGAVAIIPLRGIMLKYNTYWSYGMQEIANMMIQIAKQQGVVGIVIDGDSGGGAINSIPPLEQAKTYIRTVLKKPIVGKYDTLGSANFYQSLFEDYTYLDNELSSAAGSIGVMASWIDLKPYFEKLGIKVVEEYADQSFSKNKEVRDANTGDTTELKKRQLNPAAIGFQNRVKQIKGDKLKWQDDDRILSGSMYKGREAVEKGLVDAIGTLEVAIQKVFELSETNQKKQLVNSFLNS